MQVLRSIKSEFCPAFVDFLTYIIVLIHDGDLYSCNTRYVRKLPESVMCSILLVLIIELLQFDLIAS